MPERSRSLLVGAGIVGAGLAAVVDVLAFHLVFQHHHLLSGYVDPTTPAGFRRNVVYDGLFAAAMLGVAAVGLAVCWRALNRSDGRHSPVAALGALLAGAGAFNLFDGVVDHYLLGLHDVVHGTAAFNPHWVGVSLLLLAVGAALLRVGGGGEAG